ncbi:hypothetical protein [Nocardioides houyundeii]|uniref:hypothetical protein n=1 Tax=Nocardioides houyundeii TaxID=2045452 RepID=UPI000DF377D4|nr:hypothetical protein [Nocardioides houyundeii]
MTVLASQSGTVARRRPPALWRRAPLVAGAGLAATTGAALVIALLVRAESMSLAEVLTITTLLVGGAFGAQLVGDVSGDAFVVSGEVSGVAHAAPLTLLLVAALTLGSVFRRATRHHDRGRSVAGDALATALLLALAVLAMSLAFRSGSGPFLVATDNLEPRDAGNVGGEVGVAPVSGFLATFAVTLAVLALASVRRADWHGERMSRWAEPWRAPLRGALTLLLVLPVAGVLGALMLAGGQETSLPADPDPATGVGLGLAAVASWGYAVLALGAFARVGYSVDGTASGGFDEVTPVSSYERLGHWTATEPGLWGSVAVTCAVLLLCAAVVARHSRGPARLAGDLSRWLVLLALGLPALGLAARLRGTGQAQGHAWGEPGASEFSGTLGVSVLESAGLLLVVAAAAALVVAALARRRARPPG